MPPSRKAVTGSLPPSATPSCPCVRKITINLAPADIRKEGSAFDLPIALGILVASGLIDNERLKKLVILGELSLDGRVKPIRGGLSITAMARENNMEGVLLPVQNAGEVSVIEGIPIYPIETLPQAVEFLCGKLELDLVNPSSARSVKKWWRAANASPLSFPASHYLRCRADRRRASAHAGGSIDGA